MRMESPAHVSDSDGDSEDGNDSDDEGEGKNQRPSSPRRSTSKSILRRLRDTTSRLSFGDESKRQSRASEESDRAPRISQDSISAAWPAKEVLQDLSDEEKQQEPRRSRSGWRPSLSLIRQESSISSSANQYLQNDPNRISGLPSDTFDGPHPIDGSNNGSKEKRHRRTKGSKSSKKKKRRAKKKKRAEQLAAQQRQQQLYEQQLAEQAWALPSLTMVLEKKSRYPLGYDDLEAFLRSQRAAEYLNFWADVTAHEQLCRTFDVSERRQKRELQLEERAIARDKRRMALVAALESERLTPDPDLLAPDQAGVGAGTGIGIGASGQDVDGSNLYATSRSSLQLPLNDHLSFPQESRRYGIQDSSAAFPPMPPSHSNNYGVGSSSSGAYDRNLTGAGGQRTSGEMNQPSLEDAHISEQDAAVAAVAMRAQRDGLYPYDQNQEEVRQGSFDLDQPMPGGPSGMRYQQNDTSNFQAGGSLPNTYSVPNAYNLMMRGRGSADVIGRSSSRNSRTRPSGSEDYFNMGVRQSRSQHFQQTPQLIVQDDERQEQLNTGTMDDDRRAESPMNLQHRISQLSYGIADPDMGRHLSISRFSGGIGPLQAPASIRRSGESAYTPSIFSAGQEGKALLAQSFRTIGLEDLQESAMRIYRKYLIQLRTAPMAAEEEAAASAAKGPVGTSGPLFRKSIDKAIAPGWDGYAEEVIADWNQKWHERRSKRLSGKRSILGGVGDETHSVRLSVVGQEGGLSIDTQPAKQTEESEEEHRLNEEGQSPGGAAGGTSAPTSPTSPRLRKRTGTGLSAILNPFLTRLMRIETTVVELPTLTINTTTIEEATVLNDSAEDDDEDDDDDDDDDDEDYDSDAEDDDNEEDEDGDEDMEKRAGMDERRVGATESQEASQQSPNQTRQETIMILDRSAPTTLPPVNGTMTSILAEDFVARGEHPNDGAGVGTIAEAPIEGEALERQSTSSSLSSSWDRITQHDLQKQVTILPLPVSTSSRPSRGVRSRTGNAAKSVSAVAQRAVSALLNKSRGSRGLSPSSLDTIQVTPATSPHIQTPAIATSNWDLNEKEAIDNTGNGVDPFRLGHSVSIPTSRTSNSFVQLHGELLNDRRGLGVAQLPRPTFLTPTMSLVSNATASSSPSSSRAPSTSAPRFSGVSPSAVAVSAAAAAFYLPLECRQRIHTQVQEEGRTYAPYLYGPAKGFVMDVVLQDYYYPLFLKYVEKQNLGLLTRHHPNNTIKRRGMIWTGVVVWLIVVAIQLTLILLGLGGWKSPWVWVVGVVGGWTGSISLATGIKEFSPILGLLGKICEDKHLFRFRKIAEPSIRVRHRQLSYWMLSYCIFWSTMVMVVFAALPQRK
ncbi:hypothetical protein BGZ58_001398, partial [Dissophora ornata]